MSEKCAQLCLQPEAYSSVIYQKPVLGMMHQVSVLTVVCDLLGMLSVSWTARSSESALIEYSKMLIENCSG